MIFYISYMYEFMYAFWLTSHGYIESEHTFRVLFIYFNVAHFQYRISSFCVGRNSGDGWKRARA